MTTSGIIYNYLLLLPKLEGGGGTSFRPFFAALAQ